MNIEQWIFCNTHTEMCPLRILSRLSTTLFLYLPRGLFILMFLIRPHPFALVSQVFGIVLDDGYFFHGYFWFVCSRA